MEQNQTNLSRAVKQDQIEPLNQKIKSVFMEKSHLECQKLSKLSANAWQNRITKILLQGRKSKLFKTKKPLELKVCPLRP